MIRIMLESLIYLKSSQRNLKVAYSSFPKLPRRRISVRSVQFLGIKRIKITSKEKSEK